MKSFDADSIGYIVWVLFHKLWGRVPVNGRLRSQQWWRNRLKELINTPPTQIAPENLWDGCPAEPAPIPLEIEMGMLDLDWKMLATAFKRLNRRA